MCYVDWNGQFRWNEVNSDYLARGDLIWGVQVFSSFANSLWLLIIQKHEIILFKMLT